MWACKSKRWAWKGEKSGCAVAKGGEPRRLQLGWKTRGRGPQRPGVCGCILYCKCFCIDLYICILFLFFLGFRRVAVERRKLGQIGTVESIITVEEVDQTGMKADTDGVWQNGGV